MLETEDLQRSVDERPPAQWEKLRVRSGLVLVIDQFMLGNAQFQRALAAAGDAPDSGPGALHDKGFSAVRDYGGCIIPLSAGDWRVYRFPRERAFLLLPTPASEPDERGLLDLLGRARAVGGNGVAAAKQFDGGSRAFIETRCVVFLDWELARDKACLEPYLQLRKDGNDKEARDYLREQGAAVRYGFSQASDELHLTQLEPENAFAAIAVTVSEPAG